MVGLEALLKVIWFNTHVSQIRKLKPRELELVAMLGQKKKSFMDPFIVNVSLQQILFLQFY